MIEFKINIDPTMQVAEARDTETGDVWSLPRSKITSFGNALKHLAAKTGVEVTDITILPGEGHGYQYYAAMTPDPEPRITDLLVKAARATGQPDARWLERTKNYEQPAWESLEDTARRRAKEYGYVAEACRLKLKTFSKETSNEAEPPVH